MLGIFVLSLILIVAISLQHVNKTQEFLQESNQVRSKKVQHASTMNRIAVTRLLLLDKTIIQSDPFDRDDTIQEFRSYAPQFISNMSELSELPMDIEEMAIVNTIVESADATYEVQAQVVDLIQQDEIELASGIIRSEQLQKHRRKQLLAIQAMIEYQDQLAQYALRDLTSSHNNIYTFLVSISLLMIIVALVVSVFVYRKVLLINSELALAKDAAEASSRSKSEFVSSMSHELRTPLNAVIGFSDLLVSDQNINDSQRRQASEILNAGEHLLALINDVLDVAKLEAGKLEVDMEDILLDDILSSCQSMTSSYADKYDVEFNFDGSHHESIWVYTDGLRLKQVLLNLMSNAAKYNRKHGKVRIQSRILDEDYCRISVADTGYGLELHQMKKLFHRFERLDAGDKHIEGAGVGLALSKDLVELMNGRIDVSSELNKGSTFWVDIPLSTKYGEQVV